MRRRKAGLSGQDRGRLVGVGRERHDDARLLLNRAEHVREAPAFDERDGELLCLSAREFAQNILERGTWWEFVDARLEAVVNPQQPRCEGEGPLINIQAGIVQESANGNCRRAGWDDNLDGASALPRWNQGSGEPDVGGEGHCTSQDAQHECKSKEELHRQTVRVRQSHRLLLAILLVHAALSEVF